MKKTLKSILAVMILISMLIVLTGCGKDKEEKKTQESNNKVATENTQGNDNTDADNDSDDQDDTSSSVEEAITEMLISIEDSLNNVEMETIESNVDYNAAVAYYAYNLYEGEADFHELYNLINYIDEYGVEDAFTEYEEFVTGLNAESAEDLNDFTSIRDRMKSYFEELTENYTNAENLSFEITDASNLQQLESNIYSIDVEYSYSAIFDGEEDSGEESDTIYFIEIDGEYYIMYSEDFNIS